MKLTSALAMLASLSTVIVASTFTPIKPPSQPLAVRSPYLSTWQAAGSGGGNGGYLAGQWTILMAATVLSIIPILVLFLIAQRYFVRGVVLSGLKG